MTRHRNGAEHRQHPVTTGLQVSQGAVTFGVGRAPEPTAIASDAGTGGFWARLRLAVWAFQILVYGLVLGALFCQVLFYRYGPPVSGLPVCPAGGCTGVGIVGR